VRDELDGPGRGGELARNFFAGGGCDSEVEAGMVDWAREGGLDGGFAEGPRTITKPPGCCSPFATVQGRVREGTLG